MASAREAVIGFGRQTAKGTPLAVPKFEIAMGGGHAAPTRNVEELPWTNESQDVLGHYVNLIGGTVSLTGLPVLPKSCVALWNAALGALATSGASDPYDHAVTPSDDLDWHTFFYAEPGGLYYTVPDVKISTLTLNWSPGQPLTLDLGGTGGEAVPSDTKWGAATVTEAVDPFFTYIDAAMKIEAATTPAATTVHNIASGNISVNRNVEPIQTDGISYYDQVEQKREISVSLPDVVFEDNAFRRTVLTGTSSGTEVSSVPTYGSTLFVFPLSDGTATTSRKLQVALPRLLWATEPIDADPAGGALRYSLAGNASKPTSGAIATVSVLNGDTGANY